MIHDVEKAQRHSKHFPARQTHQMIHLKLKQHQTGDAKTLDEPNCAIQSNPRICEPWWVLWLQISERGEWQWRLSTRKQLLCTGILESVLVQHALMLVLGHGKDPNALVLCS